MADQETVEGVQEAPAYLATLPGWQLLYNAAEKVARGGSSNDDKVALRMQVFARAGEFIPKEHRDEVFKLICAAAGEVIGTSLHWSDEFADFYLSQVGREGLEQLLIGTPYRTFDCGRCGRCHVVIASPTEEQFMASAAGMFANMVIANAD